MAYQRRAKAIETHLNSQLTEQRLEAQNRLKTINKLKTQLKKQDAEIRSKDVKIKKLSLRNIGYGGGRSYPKRNLSHGCTGYVPGQCVYGACTWQGWIPDNWGSAYEWDDNARRAGYYVGSKPTVGSVGQTDAGWYGHVVVVLKVAKGKVKVKGMNENGAWSVKVYWTPTSRWTYIHP